MSADARLLTVAEFGRISWDMRGKEIARDVERGVTEAEFRKGRDRLIAARKDHFDARVDLFCRGYIART